jgi:hypothetical protein
MKKHHIILGLALILTLASLAVNAQEKKQVPNPGIERSNRIKGVAQQAQQDHV